MDKDYVITELYICTFDLSREKIISPNLDYPTRFCVLDKKRKIAVDIEHELQYDYIETISRLYFVENAAKKIKNNLRAAIFPYHMPYKENDINIKGYKIIEQLKKGVIFQDGNDALSNEDYLNLVKKEKPKKMIKRKKTN